MRLAGRGNERASIALFRSFGPGMRISQVGDKRDGGWGEGE
jgi:hypothetical protein